MSVGPRKRVEGLLPASPPRSLLDVPGVLVTGSEADDGRWLNGVELEPEGCSVTFPDTDDGIAGLTPLDADYPYWWTIRDGDGGTSPPDALISGPGGGTKAIGAAPEIVVAEPYTIWTGYRCNAADLGHSTARAAEVEARLRRRILACTPRTVEHELWSGQVATIAGFDTPYLTELGAVDEVSSGQILGFVTALGELEQALGECSCSGRHIIHAQPRVVNAWASRGLVEMVPGRTHLETVTMGTIVVAGTGYTGTDPEGHVATHGSSYAVGTGGVRVFLSPPRVPSVIDASAVSRDVNTIELRAEREALAIFDGCCLVGAQVNMCDEYCGSGS